MKSVMKILTTCYNKDKTPTEKGKKCLLQHSVLRELFKKHNERIAQDKIEFEKNKVKYEVAARKERLKNYVFLSDYEMGKYKNPYETTSCYAYNKASIVYFYEWSDITKEPIKFDNFEKFEEYCKECNIIINDVQKREIKDQYSVYAICKKGENTLIVAGYSTQLKEVFKKIEDGIDVTYDRYGDQPYSYELKRKLDAEEKGETQRPPYATCYPMGMYHDYDIWD